MLRNRSTRLAGSALVLALFLPACDADDAPPPSVVASGRYDLTTHVDVPARAVLPAPADDALAVLTGLRDAPGATLIRLLDDAGVPVVGAVYDNLPGALQDRVTGWMDDAIRDAVFRDQRVADRLDGIVALAESTLAGFDVDSTLDLGAGTHQLRTIRFAVDGQTIRIPLPDDELARTTCDASAEGDAGLALGTHSFGLAYGEYVDRALDAAITNRYGTDLRGSLDLLVDCDAVAAQVADHCVLGACVGHESELRDLCESGLDAAADEVHAQLRALDLVALQLDSGHAQLVDDAPADGVADAITGGVWQARLDAGQGLRDVTATFAGAASR